MIIKYESKVVMGGFTTPCPFRPGIMVGSAICCDCVGNGGVSRQKRTVTCSHAPATSITLLEARVKELGDKLEESEKLRKVLLKMNNELMNEKSKWLRGTSADAIEAAKEATPGATGRAERRTVVNVSVIDFDLDRRWSNTKMVRYHPGDINRTNFSATGEINEVTRAALTAFTEIVTTIQNETIAASEEEEANVC